MATSGANFRWLSKEWWPLLAVTGGTVFSMGVYFKRHFKTDPDVNAPRSRREDKLPIPDVPPSQHEGFGRKSAEATGLMEGDRPFHGIFPAGKKINEKLNAVLPGTEHDKPK